MAIFKVRFYGVTHCGYYRRGGDSADIGDLEFMLDELKEWSVGKSLLQTKMSGTNSALPTYLFDIKSYGGCWVVTLWNEVPSDKGNVASVLGTAPVGGAHILANPIVANSIPGFPTYFLFVPEVDLMSPLKHGDFVLGMDGLKNYIRQFLEWSTSRVVVDDADPEDVQIEAYLDDEEEQRRDVTARFQVQLIRTGSQAAEIIRNAALIRKVIRVREVDPTLPMDRALFQRMLDLIGLTAAPRGEHVRVRQEIGVEMTREQVRELIGSVEDDLEPQKNDVGFIFRGDSSEHWLSNSIPKAELDIAVDRADGIFDAQQLARAISRRKAELLAAADI